MFDENDIETVIIVIDPEDGNPSEYKYTKENYKELKAQYGENNVKLQDRYAWQ